MICRNRDFKLKTPLKDTIHRITTNSDTIYSLYNNILSSTSATKSIPNITSFELFEHQQSPTVITIHLFGIEGNQLKVFDFDLNFVSETTVPVGGRLIQSTSIFVLYDFFAIHLDSVSCLELVNGITPRFELSNYFPQQQVDYLIALPSRENSRLGPMSIMKGQYSSVMIRNSYLSLGLPFVVLVSYRPSVNKSLSEGLRHLEPRFVDSIVDYRTILAASAIILGVFGYVAVLDNLGRILLIDICNLLILNIWKGMRNSQILLTSSKGIILLFVLKSNGDLEIYDIKTVKRIAQLELESNSIILRASGNVVGNRRLESGTKIYIITAKNEVKEVEFEK